jgi:HSP20 family protein
MPKESKELEVKKTTAGAMPVADRVADWPAQFGALRQNINRLFDDLYGPATRAPMWQPAVETLRGWKDAFAASPVVDLVERDDEYEVQAELPGMTIKDVNVSLSDGMLTIKGQKASERKEDKEGYHLHERSFGEFRRAIHLPHGVDGAKVTALLENGILKVKLPKTAQAKAQERKIEVKAP